VSGQERQANLVGGWMDKISGETKEALATSLTIHPAESFSRNHLEVNALIAIFRVDQV
jgi:hypothetical protein